MFYWNTMETITLLNLKIMFLCIHISFDMANEKPLF